MVSLSTSVRLAFSGKSYHRPLEWMCDT